MIRSELIQKISDDNPHLSQRHVERIVNTVFEEILEALSRGDRVELRGFGSFSVKPRDNRSRKQNEDDSLSVKDQANILSEIASEYGRDTASRSKETLNYVRKISEGVKEVR